MHQILAFVRTRISRFSQLIRFGQASGLSAMLSLGLPVVLVELFGIDPDIAAAVGFATAYIANFLVLRMYVYRSDENLARQMSGYVLFSLVFRVSEYAAYWVLQNVLDIHYVVSLVSVLLISATTKYILYGKFLFKRRQVA